MAKGMEVGADTRYVLFDYEMMGTAGTLRETKEHAVINRAFLYSYQQHVTRPTIHSTAQAVGPSRACVARARCLPASPAAHRGLSTLAAPLLRIGGPADPGLFKTDWLGPAHPLHAA